MRNVIPQAQLIFQFWNFPRQIVQYLPLIFYFTYFRHGWQKEEASNSQLPLDYEQLNKLKLLVNFSWFLVFSRVCFPAFPTVFVMKLNEKFSRFLFGESAVENFRVKFSRRIHLDWIIDLICKFSTRLFSDLINQIFWGQLEKFLENLLNASTAKIF